MQRAAAPPQPPRPAVRAENVPAAVRQGNENAAMAGTFFYSYILKHPNTYKTWFLVADKFWLLAY